MNNLKTIPFTLLTILLISCNNSYKYVETVSEASMLGGTDLKEKNQTTIKAKDDSTAYLEAFKKFCISVKVSKDLAKSTGITLSTPLSFKLLNESGEDITKTTLFPSRITREKEIESQIFSMKSSFQDASDNGKEKLIDELTQNGKIDSAKIKAIKPFFRIRKDEFSNSSKTWYEPKSAPRYVNRNGLYCYFQTENGVPSILRFRLQYYSEDWLFIKKVQFAIDGKTFEFVPLNTERDNGDGGKIWEWFDQGIAKDEMELINALANAKSAKMKLIGSQYYDTKVISKDQIRDIRRTLDLYQAMGGK